MKGVLVLELFGVEFWPENKLSEASTLIKSLLKGNPKALARNLAISADNGGTKEAAKGLLGTFFPNDLPDEVGICQTDFKDAADKGSKSNWDWSNTFFSYEWRLACPLLNSH